MNQPENRGESEEKVKKMETNCVLVVTVLLAILVPEPSKSSRDQDLPAAMVRSIYGDGGRRKDNRSLYKARINNFGQMKKNNPDHLSLILGLRGSTYVTSTFL